MKTGNKGSGKKQKADQKKSILEKRIQRGKAGRTPDGKNEHGSLVRGLTFDLLKETRGEGKAGKVSLPNAERGKGSEHSV